MKENWKYELIEALIQKELISTSVGKLFHEANRECGSCYATITYSSPGLVIKAHDDKGTPLIEIGKSDDPSSLFLLSNVYRSLNPASVGQSVIHVSKQLNFLVENYKLVCDFLVKYK